MRRRYVHLPASDMSSAAQVEAYFKESAEVQRRTGEACLESILSAAALIAESFRSGGKLLLCGNGGSAADCQHMAAEFVSRLTADLPRPGLPAIALTTDTSFLTGYVNDFGFESVFARQIEALGRPGDVVMGISTSGASQNVLSAVEAAHAAGMDTIALTGSFGPLRDLATVAIEIPSSQTQHIQEAHLAVEHMLCGLVERSLFDGGDQ